MPSWQIALIAGVVGVDLVIMWWILTRRRIEALGGMTFFEFQKLASKAGVVIRDHMKANYGDNAGQLPMALPEILSKVNSCAQSNGFQLERETLKSVVGKIIVMQRLALPAEIEEALKKVA